MPPAQVSGLKTRHYLVLVSFLLMFVLPVCVTGWYMWTRAADQYVSRVGFSIRAEEPAAGINSLLGPLALGSGSSSASDAELLYQFIQSQSLVAALDTRLDLRAIWAKPGASRDPVFVYDPPGTIEDLLEQWALMVRVFYDSTTGLIELRAHAFTPEDALAISEAVFAESTKMINAMTAVAREDAIGYARDELNLALERLKNSRAEVTEFRNKNQLVDPTIDIEGQAGLLATLNAQLAEALIELDLLKQSTRETDPRISQFERKVAVIEDRIADERRKLGLGGQSGSNDAMANLVGEYERLIVDREFAEQTYTAALASFDAAQSDARRQTRYLAPYLTPTFAEKSEYPQRLTILGLVALFSFLVWAIFVLIAYSLRDRR
ncbi:hypothetical protein [Candidatus Rhodobacter oscarellae]|uniref:hypothetical protein n=1 Tax=Candidatus Rhodobacter oscarellae TaxID=1675527 RepID=UPI000670C9A9|nr:hypothetical protein [Candidatus Rhodobacter lobularis]